MFDIKKVVESIRSRSKKTFITLSDYYNLLSDALCAATIIEGLETALNMAKEELAAAVARIENELDLHGEWVGLEYDGYADGCPVYDVWECSRCKHEHNGEVDTLPDFCPGCGAKMDGGKEDDK